MGTLWWSLLYGYTFLYVSGLYKYINYVKNSDKLYFQSSRKFALLPEGFVVDEIEDRTSMSKIPSERKGKGKNLFEVHSALELRRLIKKGVKVTGLKVTGNSSYPSATFIHPLVNMLYTRRNSNSQPGARNDGYKVGLAIEGGGMRGCVAAGMAAAVQYLGLEDTIDVVYGSSAGSLVGAYFISGQLPYFGPEVYYDVLTYAGSEFIDKSAILRSTGLGLLDWRLKSINRLFRTRMGKSVLNLDFLLFDVVHNIKPLDWNIFWPKQENNIQPLKIIASGLLSKKAIIMSAADGHFKSRNELSECMRASMLLPGITGDPVRLRGHQADNIFTTWWPEYPTDKRNEFEFIHASEPMVDAQLFEPIPYRAALKDNCTHVIALRTRPDGITVTKQMGIIEKLIIYRFFQRKLRIPELLHWMTNMMHKLVYAEDILILNEANKSPDVLPRGAQLLGIALPPGVPEISRLETSRSNIYNGVREGFAAAYDMLVLDPNERGKGEEVALQVYPDEIIEQTPRHLQQKPKAVPLHGNEVM